MKSRSSEAEQQRAKEIAKGALEGRTTILEAVRALVPLAHTDAISNEDDRALVIGIDSETGHLPIEAEIRKLWATDALQTKQLEIARAEARWKAKFVDVCKRIVGS